MSRPGENVNLWSIQEIPSSLQRRTEYNVNNLALYMGHAVKGASVDDDVWTIQKFTYDANNLETLKQTAFGSWTNRSSISYE